MLVTPTTFMTELGVLLDQQHQNAAAPQGEAGSANLHNSKQSAAEVCQVYVSWGVHKSIGFSLMST